MTKLEFIKLAIVDYEKAIGRVNHDQINGVSKRDTNYYLEINSLSYGLCKFMNCRFLYPDMDRCIIPDILILIKFDVIENSETGSVEWLGRAPIECKTMKEISHALQIRLDCLNRLKEGLSCSD